MATLIQYRQQDADTVRLNGTRSPNAGRTLADALARRPAPAAHGRSELAAMEGIAELLGELPDSAARHGVLQWADALFRQGEPASVPMPTVMPTVMPTGMAVAPIRAEAGRESKADALSESDLSVDNLEDWFEEPSASPPDDRQAANDGTARPPVVSMVHDFVADFQKLARDWQAG